MSSLPPRVLVTAFALAIGCSDRPVATGEGATSTTSGTSDDTSSTTLAEPACEDIDSAQVTITASDTPLGPLAVTDAVFGWDLCCTANPMLWVTVGPPPAEGLSDPPPDHLSVRFPTRADPTEPYTGSYKVNLVAVVAGESASAWGQAEISMPLSYDNQAEPNDPTTRLVGRLTLSEGNWNIAIDIAAPHCPAYDAPSCGCE